MFKRRLVSLTRIAAVAESAVVLLVACGGGGADAPASPPPAVGVTSSTGSLLTSDGSHDLSFAITTTNTVAATAVVTTVCDGRSTAMTSVAVPSAGGTVTTRPTAGYFPGEACESTLRVDATGVGATTATASARASFTYKLIFDRNTVGISSSRLAQITESGPVQATASWSRGIAFNCLQGEAPVPADNGWYKGLCQGTTGGLYAVKWDVVHNVFYEWTGSLPTGYELTQVGANSWSWGPKWHQCMNFCSASWGVPPEATMFSWADAKNGGLYYSDAGRSRTLSRLYANGTRADIYSTTDGTYAASSMLTISNR